MSVYIKRFAIATCAPVITASLAAYARECFAIFAAAAVVNPIAALGAFAGTIVAVIAYAIAALNAPIVLFAIRAASAIVARMHDT